jgi:hypothetical protein
MGSADMKRIILLGIALLALLIPAAPVFAYNPLDQACGTKGASASSACGTTGADPITGSNGVLEKVTIIFAIISGIAAVIIIIVAGFTMITSSGNAQSVANARNAIIGAVVGLIIILTAASIITFVVNKV